MPSTISDDDYSHWKSPGFRMTVLSCGGAVYFLTVWHLTMNEYLLEDTSMTNLTTVCGISHSNCHDSTLHKQSLYVQKIFSLLRWTIERLFTFTLIQLESDYTL